MKRTLFALVVLVMALASCEGPEGPKGDGIDWDIQDITVNSRDWVREWDGDTPYYIAVKDHPISDYIYYKGNVFVYYYIRYGEANEAQTLLPRFLEFLELDPDPSKDYAWTESLTYDFMPGSIAFYYQYSDFAEVQPPTEHFRVVMNW